MRHIPLFARPRHVIFILFNLGMAILAYVYVVEPAMSVLTEQENLINDRQRELSLYAKLADQAADAEKLRDKIDQDANMSAFLPGADEGAASAFLQGRLREVAAQSGLEVRSIASAGRQETDSVSYTTVRLDATGTIGTIYRTIAAIEGDTALALFIERVKIHAPASVDTAIAQEPVLNVQFDISGAMP